MESNCSEKESSVDTHPSENDPASQVLLEKVQPGRVIPEFPYHPKGFSSSVSIKISECTPFSSTYSQLTPTCRICQTPAEESNVLISPCRCDGTLKCVHGLCLRKWLELKERKNTRGEFVAKCELCQYIYKRHSFFKKTDWRCPRIRLRDKLLHSLFFVSLIVMVACAITTILCFVTNSDEKADQAKFKVPGQSNLLTREEVVTLSCGIVFFVAFFIAMSAEIKAKKTIYQIFRKFVRYNTVWVIENYEHEK